MTQRNYLLLVLLCLVSLTICRNLQSSESNGAICCSICSQASNRVTVANPFKIITGINNLINTNSANFTTLVYILKKMPPAYSHYLFENMRNFKRLTQLDLGSCSQKAQSTGEVPYSSAHVTTIDQYLKIIKQMILNSNSSTNFRNTFSHVIDQLNSSFYDFPELSRFGLPIISSILLAQDTSFTNTYIRRINNVCANYIANKDCIVLHNIIDYVPLSTGEKKDFQLTLDQVKNIPSFSNLPKNLSVQNASAYRISLDRQAQGDESIYSAGFLQVLSNIDFAAQVYYPENQDINTYPNGGFALGEKEETIWGRLMSIIYGPYLYCRLGDPFLDALALLSSATCNISC